MTERKQKQGRKAPRQAPWHDAAEAKRRLDDITRMVSDMVWETDDGFRFTYVSERVFEVLGFHAAELSGKSLTELGRFVSADGDAIELDWRTPFRDARYETRAKDGTKRFILASGLPFYDPESGALQGVRGTADDITERQRAEDKVLHARAELETRVAERTQELMTEIAERTRVEMALRAAKERADLANRAKSAFLAGVSHELRTPLNAILGFSDAIKSQALGRLSPSKHREYIEDIHRSGSLLLQLIDDIIDVSAIESGAHEIHDEVVVGGDLIDAAVRLVQPHAAKAGVRLSIDVDSAVPALRADERRVKQILINLPSNAVKFTPRGGQVDLSARRDAAGAVEFRVADTGIGIHRDDIPKALAPFGRVEGADTRSHEGTGLGLSLVQSFADLHEARLSIDSEPGEGMTVRVVFPAARSVEA